MNAKYYIYRNLHTGGFSIKYKGRVIERNNSFIAENITFKVSEKGRQRVIKEGRKNVHAYCVADKYTVNDKISIKNLLSITYNPYLSADFNYNGKKIKSAMKVIFKDGKCYLK